MLLLVGLPSYGWLAGGMGGLLAISFVAVFLLCGAAEVALAGWVAGPLLIIKWFLLILAYHFIIFCIDEPLSDDVLVFLDRSISGLASLPNRFSDTQTVCFFVGMTIVGGLLCLLGKE